MNKLSNYFILKYEMYSQQLNKQNNIALLNTKQKRKRTYKKKAKDQLLSIISKDKEQEIMKDDKNRIREQPSMKKKTYNDTSNWFAVCITTNKNNDDSDSDNGNLAKHKNYSANK